MNSLLILIPLFCVMIINLPFKALKKSAFWLVLELSVLEICAAVFYKSSLLCCSPDCIASFFKFNLMADGLSRVLLLCIGLVLFCALLVAKNTITGDENLFNFSNLILLLLAGLNGVVIVTDIFSLYVFLEIASVASFILIAFDHDRLALEGAFKYLVLSAIATVLMLSSIALLFIITGDTSFASIATALKALPHSHNLLIMSAIGIFICGLFIKGGLMPFHGWLPDVYSSAPSSVSVILAGVVTKTLGIYTLTRLVSSIFGFDNPLKNVLLLVGAVSIIAGALAALGQKDIKRMLAYSSISQVGYIIVGLGCGTALGIFGAIFHIFNHAIFKSLLFVNSAAVEERTGTRDMYKLSGLAQKMPLTGLTSVIASLSAAGIPPLAGFWSKLIIIVALWAAGYHGYAVIAVLASVITLAYFLLMQREAFFGKPGSDISNVKEASFGVVFASCVLAVIILGLGIAFPFYANVFGPQFRALIGH